MVLQNLDDNILRMLNKIKEERRENGIKTTSYSDAIRVMERKIIDLKRELKDVNLEIEKIIEGKNEI